MPFYLAVAYLKGVSAKAKYIYLIPDEFTPEELVLILNPFDTKSTFLAAS